MAASLGDTLRLLLRFGLAGLVNTGIGYSVIAGLDIGLGVDSHLANLAGYVVAISVSYFLQRSFVFDSKAGHRATIVRYVIAAAASFLINQAVLTLGLHLVGDARLGRALAQLAAVGSYSVAFFVILRLWVFRAERPS